MKMTITTIILLIIIGLLAGLLSGLIGIGGGIIMVPLFIVLLGLS
ncbi:MAG: putative membrane protein YfcA, partial [Candidatus Azotimanducaceae bacterium]